MAQKLETRNNDTINDLYIEDGKIGTFVNVPHVVGGQFILLDKIMPMQDVLIAQNITKIEHLSGATPSIDYGTSTLNNGDLVANSKDMCFKYKLNNILYSLPRSTEHKINVYGDIIVKSSSGLIRTYQDLTKDTKTFKAFKLEE